MVRLSIHIRLHAAVHAVLIAGVFMTAATFETAGNKTHGYFGTLGRAKAVSTNNFFNLR